MDLKPEIEGVSLVFLGAFNPSIVQPFWLAQRELIPTEEADHAKVEVISSDISIFSLPNQIEVTVQRGRFQLDSDVAQASQVRDLGLGIFRLLEHTPLRAMGLNRVSHYRIASEERWHQVGDRLAPKDPWSDLMRQPGMRSLVIEERRPPAEGRLQVTVQPSQRLTPGVVVSTNEHWEGSPGGLVQTLMASWEISQRKARDLGLELLRRCLEDR